MKRAPRLVVWTVLALTMVVLAVGLTWLRRGGLPLGVARTLATAQTYELISLEPDIRIPPADYFGHTILGRTTITDPAIRQRLNAALQAGIRESDPHDGMACFNPRHAIRVTHDGQVTDIVICFECRHVYIYPPGGETIHLLTSESPQRVFDEVLTKAGAPLAKKDH